MCWLWSQWFKDENAVSTLYQNLNLKYLEWVDYETTLQITGADMESQK